MNTWQVPVDLHISVCLPVRHPLVSAVSHSTTISLLNTSKIGSKSAKTPGGIKGDKLG